MNKDKNYSKNHIENLRRLRRKFSMIKKETYFFPPEAFRELLLNAVIHKDYIQPTPIQIQVFRDRINIWNYGEMPEAIPVSSLYKYHRSVPRNPNLASIFFRCGYVESWGRGYSKIKRICDEWNANAPVPEINSGGLAVDCTASDSYRKLAAELKIDGFDVAQDVAQDDLDSFILTCIKENNKITREEIAQKAGKNKKTIERHLAKMKDKVFFDGSGFSGCWKIIEKGK